MDEKKKQLPGCNVRIRFPERLRGRNNANICQYALGTRVWINEQEIGEIRSFALNPFNLDDVIGISFECNVTGLDIEYAD